jgi:hypothetical protein
MKIILPVMLLAVLTLGAFPLSVQAHKLQPAYLEISEQGNGNFNVLWKRPLVGNQPMDIYPRFPQNCSNLTVTFTIQIVSWVAQFLFYQRPPTGQVVERAIP